jgi:hypothetical protein
MAIGNMNDISEAIRDFAKSNPTVCGMCGNSISNPQTFIEQQKSLRAQRMFLKLWLYSILEKAWSSNLYLTLIRTNGLSSSK